MLSDNLFSLDVCIFNAIDIRNIQYDQNFFELSNQITYQKQQKNHTNPVVSNNVFYWNTYSHPVTISDQFQKPTLCACHAWCAYRTIIRVPWPLSLALHQTLIPVFTTTTAVVRKTGGWIFMMTSSNENIFHVTGSLCGDFTGHRWILLTKASDAELRCFHWSALE